VRGKYGLKKGLRDKKDFVYGLKKSVRGFFNPNSATLGRKGSPLRRACGGLKQGLNEAFLGV
jgi:hypothetical protein